MAHIYKPIYRAYGREFILSQDKKNSRHIYIEIFNKKEGADETWLCRYDNKKNEIDLWNEKVKLLYPKAVDYSIIFFKDN